MCIRYYGVLNTWEVRHGFSQLLPFPCLVWQTYHIHGHSCSTRLCKHLQFTFSIVKVLLRSQGNTSKHCFLKLTRFTLFVRQFRLTPGNNVCFHWNFEEKNSKFPSKLNTLYFNVVQDGSSRSCMGCISPHVVCFSWVVQL